MDPSSLSPISASSPNAIVSSPLPTAPSAPPLSPTFTPGPAPPPRPNTDPRCNAFHLRIHDTVPVRSELRRTAWASYLKDYPDPLFVKSLLHIIDYGAAIGYVGPPASQDCRNLSTALEHPDTVTADITALCSRQRMHGPFAAPPLPHFRTSPLGIVSRPRNPSKLRVINHLSWPRGSSVNDGIPDSESHIVYEPFDSAVAEIRSLGPGTLLAKLDLKDAFRHIPVRPADWPLLGCTWAGQFYYSVVLVFGAKSAPYIFNLFAEALHWIIQRHIPASLRHYLDDFLPMFAPATSRPLACAAIRWVITLGQELGLEFQELKTVWPTTCLEFLGLELDTDAMEARMPDDKLIWLKDLLLTWQARRSCRLRELQALIGFLQFAAQVIPHSRAFIRRLIEFSTTFPNDFAVRHIPQYAHADIHWWSVFCSQWNGVHFISPTRRSVHVFTDASGSERKGIGGIFEHSWFASRIPRRFRKRDIQFKELYAVIQAVMRWGLQWAGCHVVFHIDNEVIVDAIATDRNRSRHTMSLLRILLMLAACLDFSFSSDWLSSASNALADAASRFQYARLFQLAPYLPSQPCKTNPRLSGLRRTLNTHDRSPATSGSGSHPALGVHTTRVKSHLSTSCASTPPSRMPTAASSLRPSSQSWSGSLRWEAAVFSPRRSRDTFPASALSTSTVICHSPPASPQSYSGCSGASSGSTASATAIPKCQSRSTSCVVHARDSLSRHLS